MYMDEKKKKGARFDELTQSHGHKSRLAAHLGIEDLSIVNNWRTRSVPAGYAPSTAEFLGCTPEEISASYKSAGAKPQARIARSHEGKEAGLSALEQSLIERFRALKQESADLVMQVAFGFDPRRSQPVAEKDINSVQAAMWALKGELPAGIAKEIDAYRSAPSLEEKVLVADKVFNILDRRRQHADPPDGELKRGSDRK